MLHFFLNLYVSHPVVCLLAAFIISRHKLLYFINVPRTRLVRWLPVGHMEVLIKARTKNVPYI